ncbi:MAG: PAS domain-containing sensor histidine kinase [Desulfobacterales bacterium]
MSEKPTYGELEQKVKKLEKVLTYKHAKQSLRKSLEKQDVSAEKMSEPETAVEVLDQDDAEKQPVEKALIAEHIFRRAIEESTPSGIVGIDLDGRQIYVNRAFCEMLGWDEGELLGTRFPFVYWSADEVGAASDKFHFPLSSKVSSEGIELRFRRKNGDKFWGLVTSSNLNDSEGKIIGHLISVADISKQKQAENAMRDLSSRVVNAQESERKYVSRDLHDTIGGKLSAIKYSLEKIISELHNESDPIKYSVEDVLSIVHDTIDETRRIYRNLHPSILDDLGLCPALRSLCREVMEVYSNITIKSHFEIAEKQIPDSLKILIYRILQEALNNVSKHSQADKIEVSLSQMQNKIELVVLDNGIGFDVAAVARADSQKRGLGLDSMQERTKLFSGSFDIRSTPGKGTVIRATWPC